MENIHRSASRPWISSRIKVKKFRDDWCAKLPTSKSDTKNVFKLSDTEYSELEKECGRSAMKCSFQCNMEISKEINIPENAGLETLRLQKLDLEKRKQDPQYESVVYGNAKFYNYPPHKIAGYDNENLDADDGHVKVKEPDVLLSVQIFRPEKRSYSYMRPTLSRFPVFHIDQEFMVLGCQYLTELRDKIECVSDKAIPGDYSEHPELAPEVTCKDLFKSGFFYIDGVFYNDMRHPDCRDYSEIIIDWSENKNRGIGPFRKALMENTKFIDLEIQLGYPYVYVHQGNCEHLIVFSDLLLYTHHYNSNRNDYPAYIALKPKKRVLCMVCKVQTAEWIVKDNKRLPEDPFFFCKQCFIGYNYDASNQKIGNFRVYHHIDRSNIL